MTTTISNGRLYTVTFRHIETGKLKTVVAMYGYNVKREISTACPSWQRRELVTIEPARK